jgi:hypothetical protein
VSEGSLELLCAKRSLLRAIFPKSELSLWVFRMRRNLPVFVVLLAVAGLVPATAKPKKPSLPEVFETAHTVFVETRDDRDITDISLDPEIREAILDVQDGIQDWGRYTLSRSRRDADLILVVEKGREALDEPNSGGPGSGGANSGGLGSPHVPVNRSPMQNPADASQSGPNNNYPDGMTQEKDQLRVYTIQADGKLKGPIWRSEQERGLNRPNVLLLRRLKDEVEKAYPGTPAKGPTAP